MLGVGGGGLGGGGGLRGRGRGAGGWRQQHWGLKTIHYTLVLGMIKGCNTPFARSLSPFCLDLCCFC